MLKRALKVLTAKQHQSRSRNCYLNKSMQSTFFDKLPLPALCRTRALQTETRNLPALEAALKWGVKQAKERTGRSGVPSEVLQAVLYIFCPLRTAMFSFNSKSLLDFFNTSVAEAKMTKKWLAQLRFMVLTSGLLWTAYDTGQISVPGCRLWALAHCIEPTWFFFPNIFFFDQNEHFHEKNHFGCGFFR